MAEKKTMNGTSLHRSSPASPAPFLRAASSRLFLMSSKNPWHDVENIVYPFDTDDGEILACFELLRDDGVPCAALYSLASLIGKHKGVALVSASAVPENEDAHLFVVGSFFMGSIPYDVKLSVVELLMAEVLPPIAGGEEDELTVLHTLQFILGRDFGWNKPIHAEIRLIVRLRNACQALKDRLIEAEMLKRERVARVVKGGDVAADAISGAALAVETGLSLSVPVLTAGLDVAGSLIKYAVNSPEREIPKTKAGVVASVYTDAARRATDGVRVGTKAAAVGIRDASTRGIATVSERFEKGNLAERIVPDEHQRHVLGAAGKVGVASIGAAAIVGEAVLETTSAVLKKTATVTADVVRYKYGDSAGQIVQNASDTTGNVLRTVSHVAMLESKVLSKAVAKNAGKAQVRRSSGTMSLLNSNMEMSKHSVQNERDGDMGLTFIREHYGKVRS